MFCAEYTWLLLKRLKEAAHIHSTPESLLRNMDGPLLRGWRRLHESTFFMGPPFLGAENTWLAVVWPEGDS